MSTDARQAALAKIAELTRLLQAHPDPAAAPIVEECEALSRAVAAFHMEGIRFRIYNVDRMVSRSRDRVPASVPSLLEEVRRHLETAGFHTRSHAAPASAESRDQP